MDKVIQIFTQLGVDSTIFAQFAIFTVLFFVTQRARKRQKKQRKSTKIEDPKVGC